MVSHRRLARMVEVGARKVDRSLDHKHVVVGFNKNKMFFVGVNKDKTHPCSTNGYHTIHAEMAGEVGLRRLLRRGKRLPVINLVVARVNNHGELRMSRPCCDCLHRLSYLVSIGLIANVYYSDRDGSFILMNPDDCDVEVEPNLMDIRR